MNVAAGAHPVASSSRPLRVAVFSYALGLPFQRFGPWLPVLGATRWNSSTISRLGFATAADAGKTSLFCLIGVLLGTLIGVLPGIGATATIAMLLPITFQLGDPVSSLIMLAGIYYGAQYGGSTTAILINMPGESSSAVTAIDGYQMARKGRAGARAGHRGARLLLRRHGLDLPGRGLRAAAHRHRAAIRRGRSISR